MSDYAAKCPFNRGDKVVIPAGAVVQSTNPSRREKKLTRAQTVTVTHTFDGYVNAHDAKFFGQYKLPEISWAGSGGYWMNAQVTPELCERNSVEFPPPPEAGLRYVGDRAVVHGDNRWEL